MATWTMTGDDLQPFENEATTDGIFIYGFRTVGVRRVHKYDSNTGTSEVISTAAEVVGGDESILYFKGNLYVCTDDNMIYRWVAGVNWDLVLDLSSLSPAISDLIVFQHDGVTLMYVGIQGIDAAARVVIRYSNDGVGWNVGSTDNSPPVHDPSLYPEMTEYPNFGKKPTYHKVGILAMSLGLGGSAVFTYNDRLSTYYLWNGTQFIEKATSGNRNMNGKNTDRLYVWRANELDINNANAFSTDLISWTQLANHNRNSVPSNTLYPIGAPNSKIYLWDPDTIDWGVGEDVLFGGGAGPPINNLIRLRDGTTFCSVPEFGFRWYIRSDPLGGAGRPVEEDIYLPGNRLWIYTIASGITSRGVLIT